MLRLFVIATIFFTSTASADPNVRIHYRNSVTLSVGQSVVVHGMRGRQCGTAPSSPTLARRNTELGRLSLGRAGVRESVQCNGDTPAIEVIFTAHRIGRETISLFGDLIQIHVR